MAPCSRSLAKGLCFDLPDAFVTEMQILADLAQRFTGFAMQTIAPTNHFCFAWRELCKSTVGMGNQRLVDQYLLATMGLRIGQHIPRVWDASSASGRSSEIGSRTNSRLRSTRPTGMVKMLRNFMR